MQTSHMSDHGFVFINFFTCFHVQERATEYDASGQQIESYEDEYRAKYDLKFVRGEGWRIVSGTVLG